MKRKLFDFLENIDANTFTPVTIQADNNYFDNSVANIPYKYLTMYIERVEFKYNPKCNMYCMNFELVKKVV